MPVSDYIDLMPNELLVLGGASLTGALPAQALSKVSFGQIKQTYTGSTLLEGDYIMFDAEGAEIVLINDIQYSLIEVDKVKWKETPLP